MLRVQACDSTFRVGDRLTVVLNELEGDDSKMLPKATVSRQAESWELAIELQPPPPPGLPSHLVIPMVDFNWMLRAGGSSSGMWSKFAGERWPQQLFCNGVWSVPDLAHNSK